MLQVDVQGHLTLVRGNDPKSSEFSGELQLHQMSSCVIPNVTWAQLSWLLKRAKSIFDPQIFSLEGLWLRLANFLPILGIDRP